MKKNMKSLTAHKTVLAALCFVCALSTSACGKKDNRIENKDPITGADQSQTNENGSENGNKNDNEGNNAGTSNAGTSNAGASNAADGHYSEFEAMIGDQNTDPNQIIDYINTNIAGAAESDVKNFFKGLLGFGNDIRNIDFTRLEDSRQYMPEDMIAFMDLMRLEGDTPSMIMSDKENRKVINMTLAEMLERARLFEQHLEKYPDGVTAEAAARMYEEIATNAISGGYNKAEGIAHYYKGETDDVIDEKSIQYYQQFAEANPDSNLGRVVAEYANVLQTNGFKINDTMEDFYKGLHAKFDVSKLSNNGTSTGQSDSNGTNSANKDAADTVIQGTANR